MAEAQTSPARLISQERAKRAYELRKAGASFQQIADTLGYASANSAYNAVRRIAKAIPKEVAEDLRSTQYERLQHMMLVYWPQMQAGDRGAAQLVLQIMDKIDRLMGTEQAAATTNINNTAVVVVEGDKQQYIERLKEMAGLVVPALESGDDEDFVDEVPNDDDIAVAELVED